MFYFGYEKKKRGSSGKLSKVFKIVVKDGELEEVNPSVCEFLEQLISSRFDFFQDDHSPAKKRRITGRRHNS